MMTARDVNIVEEAARQNARCENLTFMFSVPPIKIMYKTTSHKSPAENLNKY
jgi:hypothetical protein